MSEADLGRKIMLAVSTIGTRIFRFNTALSWAGRVQRWPVNNSVVIQPSDIVIRNARPIHSGFEGASDYIGWTPIKITESMVGKTMAVFTAIETKTSGHKTEKARLEKQKNFIDQINKAGGIAFLAENEDQALLFINSFRFNKF